MKVKNAIVDTFPVFRYIDTMSYNENYYRWKDMCDYEHKCCGDDYLSDEEGRKVFRKQYGYKYTQKTIAPLRTKLLDG